MCIDTNASLYDEAGIERIRSALRPGGTLAVWSAHRAPALVKRLRRASGNVVLVPENPALEPMVFEDGVEIIGKVVSVLRKVY